MNNESGRDVGFLVKQGLDASLEQLEPGVVARLQRGREQALGAMQAPASDTDKGVTAGPGRWAAFWRGHGWMRTGWVLVMLISATLWLDRVSFMSGANVPPASLVVEDMPIELFMSREGVELELLDNLDMYEWLAAEYG